MLGVPFEVPIYPVLDPVEGTLYVGVVGSKLASGPQQGDQDRGQAGNAGSSERAD
jgi:hypothetical protein